MLIVVHGIYTTFCPISANSPNVSIFRIMFLRLSKRRASLSKITLIRILISISGSTKFMICPNAYTGKKLRENSNNLQNDLEVIPKNLEKFPKKFLRMCLQHLWVVGCTELGLQNPHEEPWK